MHPNEQLIEKFYNGFKHSDAAAMLSCYHPEVEFSDPVFPALRGRRANAMWAMLTQRRADPADRTFSDVRADAANGSAHWEAKYLFPDTGRKVHNRIDATFEFQDGLIRRHVDTFDFWKWSAMALGPVGSLLGWTPFLKGKVRKQVATRLDQFIAERPEFR
jgi:ketosteroid isomerase-like protein